MIVVEITFSTDDVRPGERLAAWRHLVNRVFLPLAITPLAAGAHQGAFFGSVTGSDWEGVRVWRVRASPMSAVHAQGHPGTAVSDDYLLALHISGTAEATQHGRQVTLGPGDLALFDSALPYSVTFHGAGTFQHVIYQVPRVSLDARGLPGNPAALRVPAASSAGRLVSPYLKTLAQPAQPPGSAPAQTFIDAGLDLVVSALRSAAGLHDRWDSRRRSLAGELKRYALAHLGDAALSPQAAARASYISVRQLHRAFAREGASFTAWVREERLRRCREDLADPQFGERAAAEVAARWGFRSAAHFTRAFRARYGITPGEARRASFRT